MKTSTYHQIVGYLFCASPRWHVVAVIKGPKKAQKIYLALRRDNPSWPKEKCARIAWNNYCKNVNPDSPSCHRKD